MAQVQHSAKKLPKVSNPGRDLSPPKKTKTNPRTQRVFGRFGRVPEDRGQQ